MEELIVWPPIVEPDLFVNGVGCDWIRPLISRLHDDIAVCDELVIYYEMAVLSHHYVATISAICSNPTLLKDIAAGETRQCFKKLSRSWTIYMRRKLYRHVVPPPT